MNEEGYKQIFKSRHLGDALAFVDENEQSVFYRKDERYSKMELAHILYHKCVHFKRYKTVSAVDREGGDYPVIPEVKRREEKNKK